MFTEKFVEILQTKNITPYQVAKFTGISQGLMGEYKNGLKFPTINNLVKIANYLEVSIDYLLERETNQELTQTEKKLITDYRSLSEQGKEYILQAMNIATTSFRHHIKPNHIAIAANEEISKPAIQNKKPRNT